MSKKTNFTLPSIKYDNKLLSKRITLKTLMRKRKKQENWYEESKKPKGKIKYFCPVENDFYVAQSNKVICPLCKEKHHKIIYDKKIHDKLIFIEEI